MLYGFSLFTFKGIFKDCCNLLNENQLIDIPTEANKLNFANSKFTTGTKKNQVETLLLNV